jgi:AAA+ superfamily predicted ATPase
MAEQLIVKNLPFIRVLPAWAQELSYKYCSKTANLYILHGNIRDFLPHQMNEGEFNFTKIQHYVSEVLFGNRDIIAYYDRSSGVSFCTTEMENEFLSALTLGGAGATSGNGNGAHATRAQLLSRDPMVALPNLERYFFDTVASDKRLVLIIDYSETIIPNSDISRFSDEDRYCLVTLNRWAHDPILTQGDVSIILLTENLADISQRLVRAPSTIKVNIPFPDQHVREQFISFAEDNERVMLAKGLTARTVAKITGGLNLVNLNQLAAESFQENREIDLPYLRNKKKEMIEAEASGLLEFVETEYDLSSISGHDFVKQRFRSAARAISEGRTDVLPMGYLLSGPVGTGKSFMVTAFTKEIGIPMVKLRNLRSKWQGVTEANLEKVLSILKAMAPVGVMIDEADAFLGDRNMDGDSGTSNRIFAQIASFMGDTELRGKIIWFLITCRPDLLPIDIKRQGRAEEHLSLFYPDSVAEKEHLFRTLITKLNVRTQKVQIENLFKKYRFDFSGADLESILIRAKFNAACNRHIVVTSGDLEQTMKDFVPPAYPHEIELQNLVAVLECTSREMLPRRFQNLDRSRLVTEIKQLKVLLGEVD